MKSSDNAAHDDVAVISLDSPDMFVAGEIFDIDVPANMSTLGSVEDSASVFDEDGMQITDEPVPGYPNYKYMPFGFNDHAPFSLMRHIASDEVLSQNLFFNVLSAYGAGLKYIDPLTSKPTTLPEIRRFMLANSMNEFFLEQCTDMKHFFFCVAVVILDRDRSKIVQVRHKDACFCRFEKANKEGVIEHVFFANWRNKSALDKSNVEVLELLDEKDPLGHLEVLCGRAPGSDGQTRLRTNKFKFAVVMRFPTPGCRYYPSPYYTSLFRGDWYDIKKLIGRGKKAKIKNQGSVRYQVEIHRDYWSSIIEEERITSPAKVVERIKKEKENIRNFVTGIENSGKVWITGFYTDSYGKEQHMVRINVVDTAKVGGDWSEDIQEASNMLCYGTNIHPNLVGATPGKSQSNNSGSDKRELFTLKQAVETAFHDMMMKIHDLIIFFNGWESVAVPQVPMIMLTTLDKNTDAQKVSPDGNVSDPND